MVGRRALFDEDGDFLAFGKVFEETLRMRLCAYCLMPNHWHRVVRRRTAEVLGRRMGWMGVTHMRRYHERF